MNERADLIFDFVDRVSKIETIKELNTEFGKVCRFFGFNTWSCLQISSGHNAIREPLRRYFGNPPDAWLRRYKEAGHINKDPAAKQVLLRTNPFWWSEVIDDGQVKTAQQVVFDEAKAFGLIHGLAIPIRFPDGSIWSCLLTSENLDETNEVKNSMFLAAQFYASRGMYLKETAPLLPNYKSRITQRQREIIDLLAQGYKQGEIAKLLGISSSTVFNLTNEARERMNCRTVAELVAESILCGEIEKSHKF